MANQYRSVLASGGASTGGDALPAEVLSGKTFTNDDGAQTGTMINRGAVSGSASPSAPYTIPEGYHNGSGIVSTSLADNIIIYQYSDGVTTACDNGTWDTVTMNNTGINITAFNIKMTYQGSGSFDLQNVGSASIKVKLFIYSGIEEVTLSANQTVTKNSGGKPVAIIPV